MGELLAQLQRLVLFPGLFGALQYVAHVLSQVL
jgi:hypothetical protein